jgi:glycosyltransferase involved in cell wall biosynthesis
MAVVGLLTTSYPRSEGDPAGIFVRGFARALAGRGHHIEVLAPEPQEERPPLRDPGIDVHHVAYVRPRALERTFYGAGVIDNARRDARAWPGLVTFPLALARAARSRSYGWDAVVSHWALPCALAAGWARRTSPHLAVLHSGDVHVLRRLPMRQTIADRIARGASRLLFTCTPLEREFLSWVSPDVRSELRDRTHVSAMGIDRTELPARGAARESTGARGFVVLSLGRLVPIKGIERLVDAMRGIDAELWIAGDGPSRSAIERRGGRVRFFGTVSGAQKAALFAAADAFALPSLREPDGRTEGVPTALLEAAEAGLPIVASEVGGIASVVSHGESALLVPPADTVALRAALSRLRTDAGLRARLSDGARSIGARHAWTTLAPAFEALALGAT